MDLKHKQNEKYYVIDSWIWRNNIFAELFLIQTVEVWHNMKTNASILITGSQYMTIIGIEWLIVCADGVCHVNINNN